jgi:cobalt transporter subunit CbtA
MLFRRLVLGALLVGVLAGLFLSAVQRWQVVPLIAAAEVYEASAAAPPAVALAVPAHGEPGHQHAQHHTSVAGAAPQVHAAAPSADGHGEHDHEVAEWEPADGFERTAYTALANVLTASGFALCLLAVMAGLQLWRGSVPASATPGLLWGMAGYLSFYVAPALGLPPEIPGAQSAALEARQLWWLLAVAGTASGLVLLAFGRSPWRWGGLLLLALPHLLGAPHGGLPFAGHPPAIAAQLTDIAAQFFVAAAIANGLYWLVLGVFAAWVYRRWLGPLLAAPELAVANPATP